MMPGPRRDRPASGADQRQARLADLHSQLVDQIATLTDGDRWREWLAVTSRFPAYSFNNTILIWLQRPDATLVAGIKRWNAMGRRVRKGEKGIAILAPITARADTTDPQPEPDPPTGQPPTPAEPGTGTVSAIGAAGTGLVETEPAALNQPQPPRVLRGFKIAHVFDVSQTEGDPIDVPTRPGMPDVEAVLLSGAAPPGVWEVLTGIAAERGYRVERGPCNGANGRIRFAEQRIRVRDDVDDAQAVKTLAHELGHLLLHNPDDFVSGTTGGCRGEREVEAESVAFLTAAHVGLDTSDYTFGYVTIWAQRAAEQTGKAPHEIVQACGTRIVHAAHQLTTLLDNALGRGEPPVPAALTARITAGVDNTARARATVKAADRERPTPMPHPVRLDTQTSTPRPSMPAAPALPAPVAPTAVSRSRHR